MTEITITDRRIVPDPDTALDRLPADQVERLRAALTASLDAAFWRVMAGCPPPAETRPVLSPVGALNAPAVARCTCGPVLHRAGCPCGGGVT